MNQTFYRVIDYPVDEKIIESSSNNYGKSFSSKYNHFLKAYFKIANKGNLPIDFLVFVNNGIANFGNNFLHNNITPAIVKEFYIDIEKVTNNPKHNNYIIPIAYLNEFIQSFDDNNPFELFMEGHYLWETYLENVREKVFNELPKRKDSLFLFDNLDDCNYYLNNYRNGIGKIYEVEIIEKRAMFKGDMKIIDGLDTSASYNEVVTQFFKYWSGDSTENPVFEYSFQGKCKLRSLKFV